MSKEISLKNKAVKFYDNIKLNLGIKKFFKYIAKLLLKIHYFLLALLYYYPKYKVENYVGRKISPKLKVLEGPFKKLAYPYFPLPEQHFSTILPKISGAYEKELFPVIKQINKQKYSVFINIGSDEGYYAVGLGKLNPQAKVYAIDINKKALSFSVEMAKNNDVKNYFSVESSSPFAIDRLIENKTCIICDCEGYEKTLLNPKKIGGLINSDILVEVHGKAIGDILQKRFSPTHNIKKITQTNKMIAKVPIKFLFLNYFHTIDEMRSEECFWFFLKSHSHNPKGSGA